jgi:hypothetical protein
MNSLTGRGSAGFVFRFLGNFVKGDRLDAKRGAGAWADGGYSPRSRRCGSTPASGIERNQNTERSKLLELRATRLSPAARLAAHVRSCGPASEGFARTTAL